MLYNNFTEIIWDNTIYFLFYIIFFTGFAALVSIPAKDAITPFVASQQRAFPIQNKAKLVL